MSSISMTPTEPRLNFTEAKCNIPDSQPHVAEFAYPHGCPIFRDRETRAKFVEMLGNVKPALNFEDATTVNPVPIALGMPLVYS